MKISEDISQLHERQYYPVCTGIINKSQLSLRDPVNGTYFQQLLDQKPQLVKEYPFLPDLFVVEQAYNILLCDKTFTTPTPQSSIKVNPDLEIISSQFCKLPLLWENINIKPLAGNCFILVYRKPGNGELIEVRDAEPFDLLALKIITEELDYRQVAKDNNVSLGTIGNIIYSGVQKGILVSPESRIKRGKDFSREVISDETFFSSPAFTLQWHITQECDLHCRHCYDRSNRNTTTLEQGISVLDDLYDFCCQQFVYGQVTFTGGNPLLHPNFIELYQEAAQRGFLTGILGNPTTKKKITEIINIRRPNFFQVSLEGLEDHNDYIRGKGHFDRVFKFLEILKELGVYSMVMLTLTKENIDQVLELTKMLRGKVDRFNFNRLSMVGEGAALASADIDSYPDFLEKYLEIASKNPFMGVKDNFFNLLQRENSSDHFFGGCAGYGCGAAFNFVSLLPDGRVDACRKFDSPMGNIFKNSLSEIYHGELGERYRNGASSCKDCDIRVVCRGCMAVTHGMGKNVFEDSDPYCFLTR